MEYPLKGVLHGEGRGDALREVVRIGLLARDAEPHASNLRVR